jgi:hypothetical protein
MVCRGVDANASGICLGLHRTCCAFLPTQTQAAALLLLSLLLLLHNNNNNMVQHTPAD